MSVRCVVSKVSTVMYSNERQHTEPAYSFGLYRSQHQRKIRHDQMPWDWSRIPVQNVDCDAGALLSVKCMMSKVSMVMHSNEGQRTEPAGSFGLCRSQHQRKIQHEQMPWNWSKIPVRDVDGYGNSRDLASVTRAV